MNLARHSNRQRGAALAISMIILLVMTMIIVQGARSSNLEILIGNNSQFTAESLVQAEVGVAMGELLIETQYSGAPVVDYGSRDDDGVYLAGQVNVESVDWEGLNPEKVTAWSVEHEYIIEYIGPAAASGGSLSVGAGVASDTRYLYRVSGRGDSSRGGARVVQTVYATAE